MSVHPRDAPLFLLHATPRCGNMVGVGGKGRLLAGLSLAESWGLSSRQSRKQMPEQRCIGVRPPTSKATLDLGTGLLLLECARCGKFTLPVKIAND